MCVCRIIVIHYSNQCCTDKAEFMLAVCACVLRIYNNWGTISESSFPLSVSVFLPIMHTHTQTYTHAIIFRNVIANTAIIAISL